MVTWVQKIFCFCERLVFLCLHPQMVLQERKELLTANAAFLLLTGTLLWGLIFLASGLQNSKRARIIEKGSRIWLLEARSYLYSVLWSSEVSLLFSWWHNRAATVVILHSLAFYIITSSSAIISSKFNQWNVRGYGYRMLTIKIKNIENLLCFENLSTSWWYLLLFRNCPKN